MRRSLLLVVLVLLLVAMTVAPVTAKSHDEGVTKTTYYACEQFGFPDLSEAEFNYAGGTGHGWGLKGTATEYVWDGSDWKYAGWNETVFNLNGKAEPGSPFFTWTHPFLWGTFHINLNQNGWDIGEYMGTWSLRLDEDSNNGADTARGKEVDGKRLSKDDLDPDLSMFPAGSLDLLPPGCSPIMFTIIDPGK
jgi:hypothetical protein